jgi:hypothetical protein
MSPSSDEQLQEWRDEIKLRTGIAMRIGTLRAVEHHLHYQAARVDKQRKGAQLGRVKEKLESLRATLDRLSCLGAEQIGDGRPSNDEALRDLLLEGLMKLPREQRPQLSIPDFIREMPIWLNAVNNAMGETQTRIGRPPEDPVKDALRWIIPWWQIEGGPLWKNGKIAPALNDFLALCYDHLPLRQRQLLAGSIDAFRARAREVFEEGYCYRSTLLPTDPLAASQTMLDILRKAKPRGLTTEEWNGCARAGGLCEASEADLDDFRAVLLANKFIRKEGQEWFAEGAETEPRQRKAQKPDSRRRRASHHRLQSK